MPQRIDWYTRSVLTVIAACLLYLCFAKPDLVPSAIAQEQGEAVQTVRVDGVVSVRLSSIERRQDPQTGEWAEWQVISTREIP